MQHARTTARTVAAIVLFAVGSLLPGALHASTINSDGLHEEPWFLLDSFLELRDDWQDAANAARHFAIIWELKGCPLCQRLHETHLADAEIGSFMAANFAVLQLNIIGARRVTDFTGAVVAERDIAQRYAIEGTPTIQLFAQHADSGAPREVMRIEGVPERGEFAAMLNFVHSRAYRTETFDQYRQRSKGRSPS